MTNKSSSIFNNSLVKGSDVARHTILYNVSSSSSSPVVVVIVSSSFSPDDAFFSGVVGDDGKSVHRFVIGKEAMWNPSAMGDDVSTSAMNVATFFMTS
eukprot:CAMPEP_0196159316 /NCGR_PEP_ID=MMETSP0910-20130528/46259_1 /TAXON_ID=49265 /ORGANISM="Thalassiosira rotula, Strain GSO102" /LENGTH=97 /DNA_ID=CAMNT_0041424233 /DNA_START=421 /DNA_END=714 /DNA_ORIENTATION=-